MHLRVFIYISEICNFKLFLSTSNVGGLEVMNRLAITVTQSECSKQDKAWWLHFNEV